MSWLIDKQLNNIDELIARFVRNTDPLVPLPGEDEELAQKFLSHLIENGQQIPPLHCNDLTSLQALRMALPSDLSSVIGKIDEKLALAYQQETGAEICYNVVYERKKENTFPLLTRGCPSAAISDCSFYYAISPDYLVLPVFHTHPRRSEALPSDADRVHIRKLHLQLNQAVQAMIFCPDSYSIYGVNFDSEEFVESWPLPQL